jgi:hypothetical protein
MNADTEKRQNNSEREINTFKARQNELASNGGVLPTTSADYKTFIPESRP